MFAVVEIGGRQYKVAPKDKIQVEKLDTEEGKDISFDRILLVAGDAGEEVKIGKPYLKEAKVEGKIVKHFKGEKILVVKFIAKKRHKKTQGHRQNYTLVEITGIKL